MRKTNKKALWGSKKYNVPTLVKTVWIDDNGDEVIKDSGTIYKVADLEKNPDVYFQICEN